MKDCLKFPFKKLRLFSEGLKVLINRFQEGKKSALSFHPHPSSSYTPDRARERGEVKESKENANPVAFS